MVKLVERWVRKVGCSDPGRDRPTSIKQVVTAQAKGDDLRMDVPCAEIPFPPICKINDVSMQLHYVHVQLIYVNMHHNYVYIQLNYVNMRDRYMYVKMQPKLCCFF